MKFLTTVLLSLFCFNFDGSGGQINLNQPLLENNESAQGSSVYATATPASASDSLETISIQDLLLSGVDGNEKIKKRIISEIKDFPKNFRDYRKPIVFTTADYSFPKKLVKYDMDKGYIVFRDVSVSQWYDYSENANTVFSYSMTCDPPSTAKIRVALPTNLKFVSNFSITHPLVETTKQGVITIVIRNGTILKQIKAMNYTASNVEDAFFLSYTNSNVDVQFEGPQTLVYNKVESFLDEITSSLRDLFAQQLNEQMEERGLDLVSDCSKVRSTEPQVKKVNLPYFNNFLNNLYVIPEMKVDTWQGITISAGPIVIDGFSFNSTEFTVSQTYVPNCCRPKQLISRLKTGSLKGKFDWNYNLGVSNDNENNSTSVFFFAIDNILFENVFSTYNRHYGGFTQSMEVYLGKTKLRPSKSISDITEVKFAEFVLSEYLKSAISDSLKSSLSAEKTDDSQRSFFNSFFDT
ncbi:uncharacterized protein LOC135839459 [Planococcus citri]|uniref:uncharacterized protein LOC135839459 n=1 Tax=Planococcus citri TaxID=170843 RepID=UPI0031F94173